MCSSEAPSACLFISQLRLNADSTAQFNYTRARRWRGGVEKWGGWHDVLMSMDILSDPTSKPHPSPPVHSQWQPLCTKHPRSFRIVYNLNTDIRKIRFLIKNYMEVTTKCDISQPHTRKLLMDNNDNGKYPTFCVKIIWMTEQNPWRRILQHAFYFPSSHICIRHRDAKRLKFCVLLDREQQVWAYIIST